MKSKTLVATLLTLGLLQGCAYKVLYDAATGKGDFYPVTVVETPYAPETQARIRVLSGYVTKNSQCYGDNPSSLGQRAWTLLKMSAVMHTGVVGDSISVGMPRSKAKNSSIFTEEVVTAGQPISIRAWIDSSSIDPVTKIETKVKCFPPAISFIPASGQDYETVLRSNANTCWIVVKPLDAQGIPVEDTLTPIALAPACPSKP